LKQHIATLALGVLVMASSCGQKDDWPPDQLSTTPQSDRASKLELGRNVYQRDCIGCHGEKGDGAGPASKFLSPKPRNFTKGIFKFASVPSGALPRDEDLIRTLRNGLHRSSMPAWRLMPEEEISAVISYVKTFSPRWAKGAPGVPIAVTEDPFERRDAKGIALGRRVYHSVARCWSCHAAYETKKEIFDDGTAMGQRIDSYRDKLYEPDPKESDWGDIIKPPEFLTDELKAGSSMADLYRDVACGIGGTAMPMWHGALPEDQIWGLVHYLRSLVVMRGTPEAEELHRSLLAQPPFTPPPPPPEPAPEPAASASAAPATLPAVAKEKR
jgi:mono/diheme cytochrome c family protein